MPYQIKSPKAPIFPDEDGSDLPEMLSKVIYRILEMEFLPINYLNDCSDQCNLITAKATGLIFSLFDVTSALEDALLAYCCTYNVFFVNLLNSVDLVVHMTATFT